MTNAELIAKIKAEIDKKYAEYREKMKSDDFTYYEGMADALDLFEQFIDTLESEKPIDINFEQELYKHFGQVKDFTLGMRIGQYFYNLCKEQMLKEAVEGEVMTNGFYPYEPRIVAPYPNCPYDFGDKVRVIVLLKEDEK